MYSTFKIYNHDNASKLPWQVGASADHRPPARQVTVAVPTSLCEVVQEYSTRLPTIGLVAGGMYRNLPLRGAAGFGHRDSAVARQGNGSTQENAVPQLLTNQLMPQLLNKLSIYIKYPIQYMSHRI